MSVTEGESKRQRGGVRQNYAVELLILLVSYLSFICLLSVCIKLSIYLLYHLPVSCSSKCTFGVEMNTFYISLARLHLLCTLCTNPPPSTLLYLPLLCALPSLPFLHPSAPLQGRSQGRHAPSIPCFIGWWVLKGQFPRRACGMTPALLPHSSFPSLLRLLTVLTTAAHMYNPETHSAKTRRWQNI